MKKVLWFENDLNCVMELSKGIPDYIELTSVRYIRDAKKAILDNQWDLLILDVIIPYKYKEEEEEFQPWETEKGYITGLVFYKRYKEQLKETDTKVFVYTIKHDGKIRREFLEADLPDECFETKYPLHKPSDFWEKVRSILFD